MRLMHKCLKHTRSFAGLIVAAAVAFAPAALAQGSDAPVTRAEAEAMSPADFAERFLAGRMAPYEAVDMAFNHYGPTAGGIEGVRVMRAPEDAPEHDGFCRQSGYAVSFRPVNAVGAAIRTTPHRLSFARPITYYAERADGVACADMGGALEDEDSYFSLRSEAGPTLRAIELLRTAAGAVAAGQDPGLEVFCVDNSDRPLSRCDDPAMAMAWLADAPIDAARHVGDLGGAALSATKGCADAYLLDACQRIEFWRDEPGRMETWQVYVPADESARAIRIAILQAGNFGMR